MVRLKLKKGDPVVVITGKDKGQSGKIQSVHRAAMLVVVEGVNTVIKHQKPSQTSEGGRVSKEMPIHISNVMYADPKTGKPVKLGVKRDEAGKRVRYIKQTQEQI